MSRRNFVYPYGTRYFCSCDQCTCNLHVDYAESFCGLCNMGLHADQRVVRNQGEVLIDELNLRDLRVLDISLDTGLPLAMVKRYILGELVFTQEQLQQIDQYLQSHPVLQY